MQFPKNLAVVASLVAAAAVSAQSVDELPSLEELESSGAIIGEITYDKKNVFDTSKPGENKSLFRLANRWHVITRDSVIRQQLLFDSGDTVSKRLVAESERILRQNDFFYDASIVPVKVENGVVDLQVKTRDLWTLMPGISASRSGGKNRSGVKVSERNLLGSGTSLRLSYVDNVDRASTSFQFYDRNLDRSWTSLFLELADNSDGHTTAVNLVRPFYALDTRHAAGITFFDDSQEVSFYEVGEEVAEYDSKTDLHSVFFGWSGGLRNGWVRRWTAGLVNDRREFRPVAIGTLPALVPADRHLVYPFIGFELLQDKYESGSNRDHIDRTEDFYLGTRIWTSLGIAGADFGSDRDAIVYRVDASRGFGSIEKDALILSTSLTGRIENGSAANSQIGLNARFYRQVSDKRLFFMTLGGSHGNNLDLDNPVYLGGDSGLRGYPLRYQTGHSRLLFTLEQRYFTDWYPFKLARVGGAVFVDAGRTWGDSPSGRRSDGWLRDVGFGLRLEPTRASGRDIIHIDIAFPLDGDASIDKVQFLLESKRSF